MLRFRLARRFAPHVVIAAAALTAAAAGPLHAQEDELPSLEGLFDELAAPSQDFAPTEPVAPTPDELLQPGLEGLDMAPDALEQGFDGLGESAPAPNYALSLAARLTEEGDYIADGLVWRVFRAHPSRDGSFELVTESDEASPAFTLPEDDYVVHVAYGLANTATWVALRAEAVEQEIALQVGGLRLVIAGPSNADISGGDLDLSIFSSEQDEYGQRRMIVEDATPGAVVRLNPGSYHVVSRYGDANAVVRTNVPVKAGELTEATIEHRAAEITLKLVNEPGGEALANTNWSILSPGGDVVKESFGAFPAHVLAAGEYTVVARHEGRLYNRDFSVVAGRNAEVELVAR